MLNRDTGRISMSTKAGRVVEVAVTARVRALIEQCKERTKPCVQQLPGCYAGAKRSNYDPRQAFWRLRQKLCLQHFHAHDLRRTTALSIYSMTQDVRSTQSVLGHKNLRSTMHYLGGKALNPVSTDTMERAKLA